jgi:galactokinase
MTMASAPGRVNLIGEHTDYNAGFVLPTTIPQRARVELQPRDDDRITVWSREMDQRAEYQLGHERPTHSWLDYVQGCTALLRAEGHELGGADISVSSDVPLGSGLSSSAALEIAVLRALRTAFGFELDDIALALLGQRIENEFVGAPVGAMDQLASSLGSQGEALLIDLRSMGISHVQLPAADLIVIASGVRHDHAAGDYRIRREECEHAAALLGVDTLRDIGPVEHVLMGFLPPPLDRRVRHVVTENSRVLEAVDAIERSDLVSLGALFRASHESMRDDFEVSIPAIDQLVAIASADPAIYGARLTGGGFGGSVVAIAELGSGEDAYYLF